jgi:hypothetical protein
MLPSTAAKVEFLSAHAVRKAAAMAAVMEGDTRVREFALASSSMPLSSPSAHTSGKPFCLHQFCARLPSSRKGTNIGSS